MNNLTSYADVKTCLTCPNTKDLMNLYTADILNKLQIFIYIEQPHLTELPKFICQLCENSLNTAYAFKEQCEERTNNLLNIIKQNKLKFSTDENCSEPQINISMVKNEDSNPLELNLEVLHDDDDEFNSMANVLIKEELLELLEPEVKIEETEFLPKKVIKRSSRSSRKRKLSESESSRSKEATKNCDLKYPCPLCDEKFRYKGEFFAHRKSHKNCPKCIKVFDTDRKMLTHLRLYHVSEPVTKPCRICGKVLLKQNLGRHISSFHNRELKHFCEICNKGFYESALLKAHMIIHSESRPFKCEICEKTFKIQKYLDLHKNIHLNGKSRLGLNRNIPCKYCDEVFLSMRSYDAHLRLHDQHNESFECTVCNMKFALECRLTHHAKSHLEAFKICQICGKSLATLTTFNNHMRIHTNEKPFKCSICPKQYKHLNLLIIHKRVHSGERPYKCKFCNQAFRQRPHLATHQAVHSTEKKFSCDICGVCVGYKYNLVSHMRNVHQKERNYQCKYCTESYFSNSMLKKHLQQKHKDLIDL